MLSLGQEDDFRRYGVLAWLQTLILAAIISGAAWILGGARIWVMIPLFAAVGGLIFTQIIRVLLTRNSVLFRFDFADFWVVLFLIYATARYVTTPVEYFARLEWLTILSCASVFWVVRYSLTSSKQGVFILYILLMNGLGLSIFAIWLHFHPEFHPYGQGLSEYYAPRLIGPFGCPNHLGDFLLIAAAAGTGIAFFSSENWFLKVIILYVLLVILVVIGFTLSRGSWLGLAAGALMMTIFCMRHSSLRWFVPLALYLALLGSLILTITHLPIFQQRLQEISQHIEQQTLDQYVRLQLARDSLKIWHDNFWWGSGLATFSFEHPRYQGPHYPSHAFYAHNDYLNTLADYGLVGGLLIFAFILTVTVLLLRQVDHRAPSSRRVLLSAAVTGWAAVLVHCLFDFNMHIPACALALFALTGLGLRRSSMPGLHVPGRQTLVVHASLAVLLLAVLGSFAALTLRTANGFYPYWAAVSRSSDLEPNLGKNALPPEYGIPFLKQSIKADPKNPWALTLLGDLYALQAQSTTERQERTQLLNEAINWYQKGRAVNPLDDDILLKIGLAYDAQGRQTEAYWCYQNVTEAQPYNGDYRQALGRNLRLQGKLPEAIEAYQAALQCPFGSEGADLEIKHLQEELPVPNDPYNHAPTLP